MSYGIRSSTLIVRFFDIFKVKSRFTVHYGLLSAIKNKWKIFPTNRTGTTMMKLQRCSDQNNCQEQHLKSKDYITGRFSIAKNTKLIMLQFKINHNIIYTKYKL